MNKRFAAIGLALAIALSGLVPGVPTQAASNESAYTADLTGQASADGIYTQLSSLTTSFTNVVQQSCNPASGCVQRENGTNARWWADTVRRGRCGGQSDRDWIAFYRTDNQTWRNANPSRVRYYAANWSKVSWPGFGNQAAATDGVPAGITLCFGGTRFTENDVRGTWVWLR